MLKTISISEKARQQFDIDFVRAYHDLNVQKLVIVSSHTFFDAHSEEYKGFIYYYE